MNGLAAGLLVWLFHLAKPDAGVFTMDSASELTIDTTSVSARDYTSSYYIKIPGDIADAWPWHFCADRPPSEKEQPGCADTSFVGVPDRFKICIDDMEHCVTLGDLRLQLRLKPKDPKAGGRD